MRLFLLMASAWVAMAQSASSGPGAALRAAVEKQRASVALQRETARKQAAGAGVWLAPFAELAVPAPAPGDCEPLPGAVVAPIIESAAAAQKIQPKLLRALADQESGLRPCAVSPKGAQGLMQLMPSTVQALDVHDPFDPKQSIEAGARYLRQLLDRYKGDLPLALGAYNAGPATVDQAGGVPEIRETRDYIDAILRALAR